MISEGIIVAPATASGGALSIIRVSGTGSVELCDEAFRSNRTTLLESKTHTAHYGNIVNKNGEIIDDVIATVFRGPHSYTGEDSVEFTIHGSSYISARVIELLCSLGARLATPGEFSMRAFYAGRIDLSQAEAVSDLIASSSKLEHKIASRQMRGGYSESLEELRSQMVHILSLIELELDFSEEDVEFVNRDELFALVKKTSNTITSLMDSFRLGNAIRNGIRIAIIGAPNVGKSTLLNAILKDNRAMVSPIAGTTRDTIEEEIIVKGLRLRFIDTAGLHQTEDTLESMGIERSLEAIRKASVVLFVTDSPTGECSISISDDQQLIKVINKADLIDKRDDSDAIYISALHNDGIDILLERIIKTINIDKYNDNHVIVSNIRHYEALKDSLSGLQRVCESLQSKNSTDLLAEDMRVSINSIAQITGKITSQEILNKIFSSFCIGK